MRGPSARVLQNRVDVWPFSGASQDADAGTEAPGNYPAKAFSAVPCTAQAKAAERVDELGRVTTVKAWTVIFGGAALGYGLKINDRLDLLAADGVTVTESLYVDGFLDEAGRGAAAGVTAGERL